MVKMDNSCNPNIVHNFVLGLPPQSELLPHAIYFVNEGNTTTMYVTDSNSVAHLVSSDGGTFTLTSPNGTIAINGLAIDVSQEIIDSIITLHNNFPDLQGGTWHFTEDQHNDLINFLNNPITSTSDLINDGDGTSPFITASQDSNNVKKTGQTSQTIAGNITLTGSLSAQSASIGSFITSASLTTTGNVNSGGQVVITSQTPGAPNHATRKDYVDGLVSTINSNLANKADLVGGLVPASQLPSYVDDVLEFPNLASFPSTGEEGKIYVAEDTNLIYRWTGSVYVNISQSLALGETSSTAYRGDRGKIAYDHSQTIGNPHNTQISDIPNLEATIDAKVAQTITDGIINSAPSQDAVYDALQLKGSNLSSQNLELSPTKIITSDGFYNAFPGITQCANSDLLMAYRKGTEHDVYGNGKLILKRTTDKGFNWSNETVLYTSATIDYRDPSLTTLEDESLIMTYFVWLQNPNPLANYKAYTVKSTDNGLTWSASVEITGYANWAAISCPAIQLANGDLLIATYGRDGANMKNLVHRSTNGGASWTVLSTLISETYVTDSTPYYAEPALVLLSDGTILATIRNVALNVTTITKSIDSGATWSALIDKFPSSSRAIPYLGYNNRLLFVYRGQGGNEQLFMPCISYSDDNGNTFSNPYKIRLQGAMEEYGALCKLDNGLFGYVYSFQNSNITSADIYFKYVSSSYAISPYNSIDIDRAFINNSITVKEGSDIEFGDGQYAVRYESGIFKILRSANEFNLFNDGTLEIGGNGIKKAYKFYVGGNSKIESNLEIGGNQTVTGTATFNSTSFFGMNDIDLGNSAFALRYGSGMFQILRSGFEFTIRNNGNVGLGVTTDTGEKLQVNGEVKASPATLPTSLITLAQLSSKIDGDILTLETNGTDQVYTFSHGITPLPKSIIITRGDTTDFTVFGTTWDATNVTLTFQSPPAPGTNTFNWMAVT